MAPVYTALTSPISRIALAPWSTARRTDCSIQLQSHRDQRFSHADFDGSARSCRLGMMLEPLIRVVRNGAAVGPSSGRLTAIPQLAERLSKAVRSSAPVSGRVQRRISEIVP